MNFYLHVVEQAFCVFPLIALIFTLFCKFRARHRRETVSIRRLMALYPFLLYLTCAYCLVILPLPSRKWVASLTTQQMQLIPFHFLLDVLKESGFYTPDFESFWTLLFNKAVFQVLMNILMTVPFGVYMRSFFHMDRKRTILFSFGLSLFFELTQLSGLYFIYPRGYRLFDVDDLTANTLGGAAGYFLSGQIRRVISGISVYLRQKNLYGKHLAENITA